MNNSKKSIRRDASKTRDGMRRVTFAIPNRPEVPKTLKLSEEDRSLKRELIETLRCSYFRVSRRGDIFRAWCVSGATGHEHEGCGSTARAALVDLARAAMDHLMLGCQRLEADAFRIEAEVRDLRTQAAGNCALNSAIGGLIGRFGHGVPAETHPGQRRVEWQR